MDIALLNVGRTDASRLTGLPSRVRFAVMTLGQPPEPATARTASPRAGRSRTGAANRPSQGASAQRPRVEGHHRQASPRPSIGPSALSVLSGWLRCVAIGGPPPGCCWYAEDWTVLRPCDHLSRSTPLCELAGRYRARVGTDPVPGAAAVPVSTPAAALGVVYDVDGVLHLATLGRQLRRVRGLLDRSSRDRRSVLGMAGVLRALVAAHPDAPVFYFTALPGGFTGFLTGLLDQDGYPLGTLVPTGRERFPVGVCGRRRGPQARRARAGSRRCAADALGVGW